MSENGNDGSSAPELPVGVVYAIAIILSGCSLLYELLIAQTLGFLAANTVVWYSLTVGIYLGAMGIGALLYEKRSGKDAWSELFRLEIKLCIVGALAVPFIHLAHIAFLHFDTHGSAQIGIFVFFVSSFAAIFTVGLLTGIELPLLMRLGNLVSKDRHVTNRVLGFDYIGALAGGVIFPLVLVPHLELLTIGLVTATVNFVVALFVFYRSLFTRGKAALKTHVSGRLMAGLLAMVAAFQINYASLSIIEQYFLKKYYFYLRGSSSLATMFAPRREMPAVFRASSPYQKIDIVYDPAGYRSDMIIDAYSTKYIDDPSLPKNRYLFLNGDFQFTSNYEELYHEYFAHVPVLANGTVPQKVLVMGAGDGLLIRELVKYDQIREITHVDLDPKLVELARTHPILTAMNNNSLDDPRVRTLLGDAYQYIRRSTDTYDAIYLDFPYAKDYNVSKLYSSEFYSFVRQRLSDGGFAVLDAPGVDSPDRDNDLRLSSGGDWNVYYQTIKKAGFESVTPFFTKLERQNARAMEILQQGYRERFARLGRTEGLIQARMAIFVADHAADLVQGFLLLRTGPGTVEPYRDLGIKLHMLNELRYEGAFPRRFFAPSELGPQRVNSIMRPALPTASIWRPRSVW